MNCDERKELRDKMPRYGAYAGAVFAASLLASKKFPGWHPVSKLAESMTVGYLGGFLLAPILVRKCGLEELTEEVALIAPPVGEYGSYATAEDAAASVLRKDEAACGPKPWTPNRDQPGRWGGKEDYTRWRLWRQCANRRAQEENRKASKGGFWSKVGTMPDLSVFASDLPDQGYYPAVSRRDIPLIEARRAADPCSGIPRTINNCPPGATCAVGPSPNPEYRACIEAAQEVQKESKGIPAWVFLAAGAGVGLLLARK